jgi:hypothetical protein
MSLAEDRRKVDGSREIVWFNILIARAAEALLHCANLYKALGVEPNAHIEMTVRYGGLRGRILTSAVFRRELDEHKNFHEDEVSVSPVTFRLGAIDAEIVELVKKLCEPLFVVFDYASFDDNIYREIVTDFLRGKVT